MLAKKGTVSDGQLNVKKPSWTLSANCRMLPSLLSPRWEYLLSWTVMPVTGLRAELYEVQSGKERMTAYGAHALSKAERNYSTARKELLALEWATEQFETFL